MLLSILQTTMIFIGMITSFLIIVGLILHAYNNFKDIAANKSRMCKQINELYKENQRYINEINDLQQQLKRNTNNNIV